MQGRAKRVLVYTVSLLGAPVPLMPYERGTREFALALVLSASVLAASSFYVVRGEWHSEGRDLLGRKLTASSLITLLFGVALLVGSVVYLVTTA